MKKFLLLLNAVLILNCNASDSQKQSKAQRESKQEVAEVLSNTLTKHFNRKTLTILN